MEPKTSNDSTLHLSLKFECVLKAEETYGSTPHINEFYKELSKPTVITRCRRDVRHTCSPCRAADEVVGEYVAAATHGQPDAVLVVLKDVVGHVGIEAFHERDAGAAVVMDVVVCEGNVKQGGGVIGGWFFVWAKPIEAIYTRMHTIARSRCPALHLHIVGGYQTVHTP